MTSEHSTATDSSRGVTEGASRDVACLVPCRWQRRPSAAVQLGIPAIGLVAAVPRDSTQDRSRNCQTLRLARTHRLHRATLFGSLWTHVLIGRGRLSASGSIPLLLSHSCSVCGTTSPENPSVRADNVMCRRPDARSAGLFTAVAKILLTRRPVEAKMRQRGAGFAEQS